MKMPGKCTGSQYLSEEFGKCRKRHLGSHDLVSRVDWQGESLIWCRKCSGYARQRMGPKLMIVAWQDVETNSDSRRRCSHFSNKCDGIFLQQCDGISLQHCDGISGQLSVARLRVCGSFPIPGQAGVASADRTGSAVEQRRSTRAARARRGRAAPAQHVHVRESCEFEHSSVWRGPRRSQRMRT